MESISARLKVSPATSPYSSSFLVPRGTSLCSWIITLQALWFFAAPLGAWEGHICSSFLVFRGTPLELSQSHAVLHVPRIPSLWVSWPNSFTRFCWIFNGLFAGNLNIHRAFMLILLAACPLVLPEILATCPLTEILFFFLYYFFLFPYFWDFGPSWSFLTSWIGPSFVKAHGLSLLFMEWAFLWNFGP